MLQGALVDMFPKDSGAVVLLGDLDTLAASEIFEILEILETRSVPVLAVAGDWRNSGVDVYDIVMRFAEERYAKMRHRKFSAGMYVVIMGEPLEDLPSGDDN